MKTFWLFSVKVYLRIGLFFYYRSIKVYGLENISVNKPTLIICNHQNALIDALILATRIPKYAYFLTRAGVFYNTLVNNFLNNLNMLPVYRIVDGWRNLAKNNPVFEKVSYLLSKSQTVVIFPEGRHNLVRRVRPLNKGFTRIIFDTLDQYPELDLELIPFGLNFRKAEAFVDEVAMYIGTPIPIVTSTELNKREKTNQLKADTRSALSKLTTDIPKEYYEETLNKIEDLNLNYLDPKTINSCIANDFINCDSRPKSKLNGLRQILKILLILNLLIPYIIWKYLVEPKIIETEFTSTFRFGIAIVLVPIYLLATFFVLSNWIGFQLALLYVIFVIIIDLLVVKL